MFNHVKITQLYVWPTGITNSFDLPGEYIEKVMSYHRLAHCICEWGKKVWNEKKSLKLFSNREIWRHKKTENNFQEFYCVFKARHHYRIVQILCVCKTKTFFAILRKTRGYLISYTVDIIVFRNYLKIKENNVGYFTNFIIIVSS